MARTGMSTRCYLQLAPLAVVRYIGRILRLLVFVGLDLFTDLNGFQGKTCNVTQKTIAFAV